MILPFHLLPEALGLHWGMTQDEWWAARKGILVGGSDQWNTYRLTINGTLIDLNLAYDENGLGCIFAVTHQSRDFWDPIEEVEYEAIEAEFDGYYERVVAGTIAVIGSPDYVCTGDEIEEFGSFSDLKGEHYYDAEGNIFDGEPPPSPLFCKWLGDSGDPGTLWKRPEGQLQVRIEQQDKEFPIEITLLTIRPE